MGFRVSSLWSLLRLASDQVVYIEEMGESDMEMMTVSRLDFWPIHKENIENAKKVEEKVRHALPLASFSS